MFAQTPAPPYYAVIFTSKTNENIVGYNDTANLMMQLAATIDGFLGVESARSEMGITVSYWRDLDAINAWRNHLDHKKAKEKGQSTWYNGYKLRIAFVERDYDFDE